MSPRWRHAPVTVALVATTACPHPDGPATDASSSASASTTAAIATADETAPDDPRISVPLVDHDAWVELGAADDPLAAHRPDPVECGVGGAYYEDAGLEIDTTVCNYLARQQPALAAVRAGDRIEIAAFHDILVTTDPGDAHFAVLVGEHVVWEVVVPIPATPGSVPSTPFTDAVEVDFDAPAGTPVTVHLHNHGFNRWTLLHVDLQPAP